MTHLQTGGSAVAWNMQFPPGIQFPNPYGVRDAFTPHLKCAQQQLVSLSRVVVNFTASLSNTGTGTLSQIWLPSVSEDGSVVLSTQGVPFSVSGTVDLLALFRCISCRFKFTTDVTKPSNMGVVGRVFASGEPEFSHNVQTYDKSVYLRVSDAQRCRVHSTMLLPLYMTAQREHPFAVFEVCQTETNVLFPSMVDLLQRCLEDVCLYTVDIEKHSMGVGLRAWPTNVDYTNRDSASVVTYGHEGAGPDLDTRCSADSVQQIRLGGSADIGGDRGVQEASRREVAFRASAQLQQVKAEKIADSEEVGGKAAMQARPSSLLPPSSAAHIMMHPQQRRAEAQEVSRFAPSHASSQGPGAPKGDGPARLVNVGNRLELDLEPLLTANSGPLKRPLDAADLGRQGSDALAMSGGAAPVGALSLPASEALQGGFAAAERSGSGALLGGARGQYCHPLGPPPQGPPLSMGGHDGVSGGPDPESLPWGPPGSVSDGLAFCDEEDDDGRSQPDSGAHDTAFNNRVGGGAGKRLSLQDLQAQFGVGLREAASNLRICPTTLKRACRRHGIKRWPRRQLAKLGNRNSEGSSRSEDPSGSEQQPAQRVDWTSCSGRAPSGRTVPSLAPSSCAQQGPSREEGNGMTTRALAAATTHAGRAHTSPGALAALDIPAELQHQDFYMGNNTASAGILDLFHSISPTAASGAGAAPPAHATPLLHPDDMLW